MHRFVVEDEVGPRKILIHIQEKLRFIDRVVAGADTREWMLAERLHGNRPEIAPSRASVRRERRQVLERLRRREREVQGSGSTRHGDRDENLPSNRACVRDRDHNRHRETDHAATRLSQEDPGERGARR